MHFHRRSPYLQPLMPRNSCIHPCCSINRREILSLWIHCMYFLFLFRVLQLPLSSVGYATSSVLFGNIESFTNLASHYVHQQYLYYFLFSCLDVFFFFFLAMSRFLFSQLVYPHSLHKDPQPVHFSFTEIGPTIHT